MNLEPLRRLHSKLSVAFVAATALFLTSCGGGGASSSPASAGALQLLPSSATIYAGVPYTFNITGGRKPYLVTSSEPTLIELNFTTDESQFSFVARNPGVVDVGLDPNEVPRRSVNIEVRDSVGTSVSSTYSVLQNFFTGYGQTYANSCASVGTGGPPQACSGTDSVVTLIPVSNGGLYGNREFQLDRIRGDYSFVVENQGATPQLVNQLRVRTDQTGRVTARLRVAVNAVTQIASYSVTDVLSGVTTTAVFLIVQQAPADAITIVPNTLTFTGLNNTRCGSGSADVFVFGGVPPYSVVAAGGATVTPSVLSATGSRLTINVGSTSPPCPIGNNVVVTDSRGAVATVDVTIAAGSAAPPTLAVAPTTVSSLLCGQSIQVTAVGGRAGLSVTSQHPRITATMSGTTLTLTRLTGDGATSYPTSGSAVITDGSTVVSVAITATPANCP